MPADCGETALSCDVVVVAIGQEIQADSFAKEGMACDRGSFLVERDLGVVSMPGVYAGGDCMRGPATAILAIADGQTAAKTIDRDLGFHRDLVLDIELPPVRLEDRIACGRAVLGERPGEERRRDFELVEYGFSDREMRQEAARCLNCDHFGCGILRKEGRLAW